MSVSLVAGRAPYHMTHPGPVAEKRVDWTRSRLIEVVERLDGSGLTLLDAVADVANRHGLPSGTGQITAGRLSATRYTTGGPARDGKAANYTYIREQGAANLPWGMLSFGHTTDGARFVHCHALIEADGAAKTVGGHLFPADCIIEGTIEIKLCGLPEVDLVQQSDAETLHSVFEVAERRPCEQTQALFVRVRPNEDLTLAVERACAEAGLADGELGSSLGSLNAPVLRFDDGREVSLSSVGMEALSLTGTIAGGRAQLHATLVDEAGTPHQGALVRGLAPVCVTAELLVEAR